MISIIFGLHPFVPDKPKQPQKANTAYIFHDFSAMCKPKSVKSLATAYNLTVFLGFCKPYRGKTVDPAYFPLLAVSLIRIDLLQIAAFFYKSFVKRQPDKGEASQYG